MGFGIPATESPGRRAASLADVANQSAATSAEEDNQERDAYLRQVEARDLIEFGMIPVSLLLLFVLYLIFILIIHICCCLTPGICWSFSCLSGFPFSKPTTTCSYIDRASKCYGSPVSDALWYESFLFYSI